MINIEEQGKIKNVENVETIIKHLASMRMEYEKLSEQASKELSDTLLL